MSAEGTPDTGQAAQVRIAMPHQLRALSRTAGDVLVEVATPVTVDAAISALEAAHPVLVGRIRDRETGRRRPMIRIYADGEDYSDSPTATLPDAVLHGRQPLRLVGAIAGG